MLWKKKIGNNKYLCSYIQEIILVSEKEDDNLECSWKGIDDSIIKRAVIPKATHTAVCDKSNWLRKSMSWH